jgi:hypothetical protein
MFYRMSWHIEVGEYSLGFLDGVEIHKSVDLLADTCSIKLPATIYNKAIKANRVDEIEGKIKRGDVVKVWLGYDKDTFTAADKLEFEGYLSGIQTDDGSIILNCEDDIFLFRKSVKDKQFKSASVKTIVQYLMSETGNAMQLNCTLTIDYDKFIIHSATAFDVLKKIQEETKGNIYISKNAQGQRVLNVHLPYTEKHGYVEYSFQKNIETSDLKYKKPDDKTLEVIIESTGKDGKKIKVTTGKPGGDKITIKQFGMTKAAMKQKADATYKLQMYEGYEGGITTWLIPYVEPGYSAHIHDDDYEFKNGWYYVNSVTTTFDGDSGGTRKVELGIKTAGNGQV